MKNIALILLMSLGLALTVGCDDDPVDAVTYKLTVENRSGFDFDVYIKSTLNTTYVSEGTVLDGNDKVINGLVIDVEYTVGLVEVGGDPSTITNETTFTNNDPETVDYILTIN